MILSFGNHPVMLLLKFFIILKLLIFDLMVFRVKSINFIDPSSYKDDDDKVVVDIKPKNSCT
jgi:hypothetical protein